MPTFLKFTSFYLDKRYKSGTFRQTYGKDGPLGYICKFLLVYLRVMSLKHTPRGQQNNGNKAMQLKPLHRCIAWPFTGNDSEGKAIIYSRGISASNQQIYTSIFLPPPPRPFFSAFPLKRVWLERRKIPRPEA